MTQMLIVSVPDSYRTERAYILNVLLEEFLGLGFSLRFHDHPDTRITTAEGGTLVIPDGLFATPVTTWLTSSSLPVLPLANWQDSELGWPSLVKQPLPVLWGKQVRPGDYMIWQAPRTLELALDVLGASFFMLTRYEEVAIAERDRYDRFSSVSSISMQAGFLERPLVNEYLEVFWYCLTLLWPGLERRTRVHRVLLSHDVDRPFWARSKSLKDLMLSMGKDVLRRGEPAVALRRARSYPLVKQGKLDADIFNTFDFIMSVEEEAGRRGAFYFIPESLDSKFDADYQIEDPWLGRLIRRIHDRGHEIGLHTSFHAYQDPDRTHREFQRLKAVVDELGITQPRWGGRQHYLRWKAPDTWNAWDYSGLDYDSSLGFADHPGFRCGTCYEYPTFDLQQAKPLKLRERPLVVMECSLLSPKYLALGAHKTLEKILELADTVKRFRGDMTVLWHNSELQSKRDTEIFKSMVRTL